MITSAASGGGAGIGVSVAGLGLAMLTCPPQAFVNNVNNNAQEMDWILCTAAVSKVVTKLGIWVIIAGATPGAGINGLAIYSEAGTLLGQTGDMTTAMESTGWAEGTLTAGVQIVAGTNYYLAEATNFTGTLPSFAYVCVDTIPPLNGHYFNLFANGKTSFPASFTPSAVSAAFPTVCMYAA